MVSKEYEGSKSDRERELKEYDDTKAGVRGLVEAGVTKLPRIFILPSEFRADCSEADSRFRVPVVDLQGLGGGGRRRGEIVGEIRKASETWGIFQVMNHGVPLGVVRGMLQATLDFHEQPKESKVQYYTRDANKPVAYRTTVHPLLRTALWKDTLACMFDGQNPEIPLVCREAMYEYVGHMFALKKELCELVSESLGLASDRIGRSECTEAQKLAAHYYPPCPEPHLTLGSPKHADPYFLTIISQNLDGLQVLHQDQWIDVPPLDGALVIIIGDMLQMMSNDLYKSVEHRAVPRGVGTRLSVACFFHPSKRNAHRKYGVIDELVTKECPALYRETSLVEYLKYFGANGIVGSKALPHFKCMQNPE